MDILRELPVEVAQKILGMVSPEDLLACSAVSRTWRSLVDCPPLWRRHCSNRGWKDALYVEQNRTHYKRNFLEEAKGEPLWPLNKWALNFQVRSRIPVRWERRQSVDYRLSPRGAQVTVLSCDGRTLAVGHADGVVSVLDVLRVPRLVTDLRGLLEDYRVLALAVAGPHLVLMQSMLLQIYMSHGDTYSLVDAKSFEMGFAQIEVLQRYSDTLDSFVAWYSSEIESDRHSKESIAATVHFELSGELMYVGVRDFQMVYVWSLVNGRRESTIHIPSSTCKLRDLFFYEERLYIIYASRNIRHITAYDLRENVFIYEVTTTDCKTQKLLVNNFLVGIAISGPGLTSAGVIRVWDKDTGKQVASRNTDCLSFKTVTALRDLIIYSERTTVYVWEPKNDFLIKSFSLEETAVFLHPCPYRFLLVYAHGSCWLCDWLQGSKLYRHYPQHVKSGDYRGLVYSDDTMLLMKADFDLIEMVGFC